MINQPSVTFHPSIKNSSSRRGNSRTNEGRGSWKVTTILLLSLCLLLEINSLQSAEALSQSDSINAAINWLMLHQQSDGSYGSFTEPQTATAAYAMWIRFQDTTKV